MPRKCQTLRFQGRTRTVTEWSIEQEIPADAIKRRLADGWTTRRALTTSVGKSMASGYRVLRHAGESLTIPEWSFKLGLDVRTIRTRLCRGWSVRDALTTEPGASSCRLYKYRGRWQTLIQLSERYGVKPNSISVRRHRGWTFDEALGVVPRGDSPG